MILKIQMVSIVIGFILDAIIGDPRFRIHPIRLIGSFIAFLDRRLNRGGDRQFFRGLLTVFIVSAVSFAVPLVLLILSYKIHPYFFAAVNSVMCYFILAAKSLKKESMAVYERLDAKDTDGARRAVSMIVGRDTESLNEEGIIKAAVETVAENTSDGVIAPMLFFALGGGALGFFYKAVNTMDSMIGYKNEKYKTFGTAAAKLDDFLNYIPARISAAIMILSSLLLDFNSKNALKIYKRDRKKSKSPNAGQTESVCAGALGIELLGNAYYFGKLVEKPSIGDKLRDIRKEDISDANDLMYCTSALTMAICVFIFILLGLIF